MQLILIISMLNFSLEPSWEKLFPGFYNWFLTHRKKDFLQGVSSLQEKVQM